MPQQTKSKRATNKKKKLSKIPFIYIVILLIAVVITVCLVVRNSQSKNGEEATKQSKQNQQNEQSLEEGEQAVVLPQQSLIDMNNTENAKVEDGVKENTSSKLLQTKTFKGLTFKNIRLAAEGGITRLTATVENTSSQDYEGGGITVVFTNKDGSEYARLNGVLSPIRAGDTNELDAGTTSDIANAYDFTIE